jgi:hydroxymethylpyrimidine/phosphomethylpyrimidine kinase
VPIALTISAFDTSGAGGVQRDLHTFAEAGVRGVSVATVILASAGVGERGDPAIPHRRLTIPPGFIAAQIDAVARRPAPTIDAVRVGYLDRAQTVAAVAERLRRRKLPRVVWDPVFYDLDGARLLPNRALELAQGELLPEVSAILLECSELPFLSPAGAGTIEADERAPALLWASAIHCGRAARPGAIVLYPSAPAGPTAAADPPRLLFEDRAIDIPIADGLTRARFSARLTAELARGERLETACLRAGEG